MPGATPHRHGPAPPQGHQTPAGWMLAPAGRLLAGMLGPPPRDDQTATWRLGGPTGPWGHQIPLLPGSWPGRHPGHAPSCSGRRRRPSGRTARPALSGNCSAPGRSSCAWPGGPPGPPGPPSPPKHCLTQAGRAWRHPTPTPGRSAHQAPHKAQATAGATWKAGRPRRGACKRGWRAAPRRANGRSLHTVLPGTRRAA